MPSPTTNRDWARSQRKESSFSRRTGPGWVAPNAVIICWASPRESGWNEVGNHTTGRTDRAGGGQVREVSAALADNMRWFYAFCRLAKEHQWPLAFSC